MSYKKYSIDLSSTSSTQCDSCEQRDDQLNFVISQRTNPLKYKTQMCKKFSTTGFCNYGDKCKFAHGIHQLIRVKTNQHFRKKKCSKYWSHNVCPYGVRCQFGHSHVEQDTISILKALQSIQYKQSSSESSKLIKLLSN